MLHQIEERQALFLTPQTSPCRKHQLGTQQHQPFTYTQKEKSLYQQRHNQESFNLNYTFLCFQCSDMYQNYIQEPSTKRFNNKKHVSSDIDYVVMQLREREMIKTLA